MKIDKRMLEIMRSPETKAIGLSVSLMLTDGSKRQGIYQDLVINPLNQPGLKNVEFIKFVTNKPEKGLIVYLPLTEVDTIEWAT